jgi:site-specific recombinase XerD
VIGVAYILERLVAAARPAARACATSGSRCTCRHTTAMHLLQAGVDLSVIAP